MIANVIIAGFLLFMVYWWSGQGLFSSLLNLVLTVIAAALALAIWEPVTYGLLLNLLPEVAWGAGLLLPFGIILLVLRVAVDTLVGGNLNFSPAIDKLGGAVFGFAAGVLTAGMLVLGLQMAGTSDFFGHRTYDLDPTGRPIVASSLWVPVDNITASFLATLSDGSLAPITGEHTLGTLYPAADHPGLAVHASLFTQNEFPGSRKSLRANNAEIVKGAYHLIKEAPPFFTGKIKFPPGQQVAVIGVQITVQGAGGTGAADVDGISRVTRKQVELGYSDKDGGKSGIAYPVGYVQNGELASLLAPGEYAYSSAAAEVTHHWVFQLPPGVTPTFIRIKGARLDLPQPANNPDAVAALVTYKGKPKDATAKGSQTKQPGTVSGTAIPAKADFIRVSDRLPGAVNKNALNSQGIEFDPEKGIVRGEGNASIERGIGKSLSINSVNHPNNTAIVQVNLGVNSPGSLLGRIKAAATAVTQAPVLVDEHNNRYYAIGYTIGRPEGFRLRFDANDPIRALAQIPIASASPDDNITLYYQVQKGVRLTRFDLGTSQSQDLSIVAIDEMEAPTEEPEQG